MFFAFRCNVGLTPKPGITRWHPSGAEGLPMEVLLVIAAVVGGIYLFRRLRARPLTEARTAATPPVGPLRTGASEARFGAVAAANEAAPEVLILPRAQAGRRICTTCTCHETSEPLTLTVPCAGRCHWFARTSTKLSPSRADPTDHDGLHDRPRPNQPAYAGRTATVATGRTMAIRALPTVPSPEPVPPPEPMPTIFRSAARPCLGFRRSHGGWCETQLKPPIPTIRAVCAWQRWSDRSHEPGLAAALEDGGSTGKDRGGDLGVRGPAVSIREVLDAAGRWPPSSTRSRQQRWR